MAAVTLVIETPKRIAIATTDTYQELKVPRNARYLRLRYVGSVGYLATTGVDGDPLGADYETDNADTTFVRKVPGAAGRARPGSRSDTTVSVFIALAAGTASTYVEATALYEGA